MFVISPDEELEIFALVAGIADGGELEVVALDVGVFKAPEGGLAGLLYGIGEILPLPT
jgi:hypothetical protein